MGKWANHLIVLSPSFLLYKMRIVRVPISWIVLCMPSKMSGTWQVLTSYSYHNMLNTGVTSSISISPEKSEYSPGL